MGSRVLLQLQIHWDRATEAKGTELCESHTSLRRDPGVVCSLSATDLPDYCWQKCKGKESVLGGLDPGNQDGNSWEVKEFSVETRL